MAVAPRPRRAGQGLEGVDDARACPPVALATGTPPARTDVVAVTVAPLVAVDRVGPVSDNGAVLCLLLGQLLLLLGAACSRPTTGSNDGGLATFVLIPSASAGAGPESHWVRYLTTVSSDGTRQGPEKITFISD